MNSALLVAHVAQFEQPFARGLAQSANTTPTNECEECRKEQKRETNLQNEFLILPATHTNRQKSLVSLGFRVAQLLLLVLLRQKHGVNQRHHSPLRNGDPFEQLVQLLVVANRQQQMTRRDAHLTT